jgi:hypothetical protein
MQCRKLNRSLGFDFYVSKQASFLMQHVELEFDCPKWALMLIDIALEFEIQGYCHGLGFWAGILPES